MVLPCVQAAGGGCHGVLPEDSCRHQGPATFDEHDRGSDRIRDRRSSWTRLKGLGLRKRPPNLLAVQRGYEIPVDLDVLAIIEYRERADSRAALHTPEKCHAIRRTARERVPCPFLWAESDDPSLLRNQGRFPGQGSSLMAFPFRSVRGGSACPNTELASISGALRVWHRCRVVHGGGRAALATQCTTDAVGNSCSPLKLPV